MRKDGRTPHQVRNLTLTPHFSKYSDGSVLIEAGGTKVLCNVTVEDGVPAWMRGQRPLKGWLTAEYSMLPQSTHSRTKRERPHMSGRTQEIQRLIGRSLRAAPDFALCPDLTFLIDCDVLQADGGTRTAAITGAYAALELAVAKRMKKQAFKQNPLKNRVAAISVGVVKGEILVDLDYAEDTACELDMNIVMNDRGEFIELQGTAERSCFSQDTVNQIMTAAKEALAGVFALQEKVVQLGEVVRNP